jgi:hypothetical protein
MTWRLAGCRAVNRESLLALALCAVPVPLFAQAAFVQAGYGVDLRRFSGENTGRVFDANAGTLTIGGAGFLTSTISAGLEVELGANSRQQESVTVTLAGRPETVTTTYESRRRSVSALVGLHSPAGRAVRAGVYGGLSILTFRRITSSDAPPIVLSAPPPPTVFSDRVAGPVMQADVAIRLAAHAAVVGTVRARGLDLSGDLRGFSIQPGALLRLSF